MEKAPTLRLKSLPTENDETLRIMGMIHESCDRLNAYVMDFFETMAILNENLKNAKKKKDRAKQKEIEESIAEVERRISEVTESMQGIVKDMPELVELVEAEK